VCLTYLSPGLTPEQLAGAVAPAGRVTDVFIADPGVVKEDGKLYLVRRRKECVGGGA
jgi:hypothetical protein